MLTEVYICDYCKSDIKNFVKTISAKVKVIHTRETSSRTVTLHFCKSCWEDSKNIIFKESYYNAMRKIKLTPPKEIIDGEDEEEI